MPKPTETDCCSSFDEKSNIGSNKVEADLTAVKDDSLKRTLVAVKTNSFTNDDTKVTTNHNIPTSENSLPSMQTNRVFANDFPDSFSSEKSLSTTTTTSTTATAKTTATTTKAATTVAAITTTTTTTSVPSATALPTVAVSSVSLNTSANVQKSSIPVPIAAKESSSTSNLKTAEGMESKSSKDSEKSRRSRLPIRNSTSLATQESVSNIPVNSEVTAFQLTSISSFQTLIAWVN